MPKQLKQGKQSGGSGKPLGANTKGYSATKHTHPKNPSKSKSYSSKDDKTLSASQAKTGGYRPQIVSSVVAGKSIPKGSFRSPSNPTKESISSGYHESFMVTDSVDLVSKRKKSNKGFAELPKTTSGFWKKHSGAKIIEKNLKPALEASDGARTDTARTILTAPGGKGAGHSGSGVKTTGQSHAHDLLRDQSMLSLTDPKMTPAAQAVIAANTTLWSMAPGLVASKAEGASKLKGKRSRATWEEDRNEVKRRVNASFQDLSKAEKKLVLKHEASFVKSIGDKQRKRSMDRPGSPPRETAKTKSNPIYGGGYVAKPSPSKRPKLEPPKKGGPREMAQYMTQPFRIERRCCSCPGLTEQHAAAL